MQLLEILKTIIHPEQGRDIVSLGMVEKPVVSPDGLRVSFTLRLTKPRDPAAQSLRRAAERAVSDAMGVTPVIIIADPIPQNTKAQHQKQLRQNTATSRIGKVIAIASAKGGVGKSSVTANLAIALAKKGFKVGVIDADIYGPSMPTMFNLAGHTPITSDETTAAGDPLILPGESYGVKVMSIGFFIKPSDALVWRGPMATTALRQLIHQTQWGELDFLLIDLPPGTGDVHLTVIGELKIDGALIVTTPAQVSLTDVVRGISMFRSENVNIPIIGIVENMSYFSPPDGPDRRYYIFGKGRTARVADDTGLDIVAQVAILEALADGGDSGTPLAVSDSQMFEDLVNAVCRNLIEN